MRKLINYLLAMPLLMLAACSSEADNTPAHSAPTYTMTGNTGAIESRVTYKDVSNVMNCRWEKGDTVLLKADGADETYAFVVKSVDAAGVGTMAHKGAIPSADNFTGTATYAPRDAAKAGVQIDNDSTTHLKYGETMVATLTGQKIDGASLVFIHPATAVYKVTFKAPAAFSAGSTLTMSGAWTDDAVLTLNFSAAKDGTVIAYIIHTSGSLATGGKMKISLAVKDGDTYSYTFTSTKALTYDANKYWLVNISEKTMEKEDSDYVDLGLSVKWAKCNLGASKPEDYGDYYGWGCSEPYYEGENADFSLYFQKLGGTGTSLSDCGTEKDPLNEYAGSYSKSIENTKWDVAHERLGSKWRMPTSTEAQELRSTNNCSWEWATENGVKGQKVTSKKNGNYIFLPAVGYRNAPSPYYVGYCGGYWTSTPYKGIKYGAERLYFYSEPRSWNGEVGRQVGYAIRPVSD